MAIPTLHSGQLYGPQGYPYLVDADIVSKGALDHWRVVIDVQDGHLQDVVLLPWRGATVGRHNLQGGGRLESGLEGGGWMRNMESRWAVWGGPIPPSWGGLRGQRDLLAHLCPLAFRLSPRFHLLPYAANNCCLIPICLDTCLCNLTLMHLVFTSLFCPDCNFGPATRPRAPVFSFYASAACTQICTLVNRKRASNNVFRDEWEFSGS